MRCVVRHGALMPCPRGLPMVKLGAAPPPPAAGALTSSAQACTRPGVAPIVTLSVPVLPLARLASVPAITPLPTGLDASAYSVTPDGHVVTSTSLASLMRMTRVSPARLAVMAPRLRAEPLLIFAVVALPSVRVIVSCPRRIVQEQAIKHE